MAKQTYTSRIQNLNKDYGAYRSNVDAAATCQSTVQLQYLKGAITSGKRVNQTVKQVKDRVQYVLMIALQVAGLKDRIGSWELDLYSIDTISTWAMPVNGALLRVRLIMHNKKWKGTILRCPLLKIMPNMQFPLAWLDMSDEALRKEMNKLI